MTHCSYCSYVLLYFGAMHRHKRVLCVRVQISHKQLIYIMVPEVCDCYNCARLLPLTLHWDTSLRLLHWQGYDMKPCRAGSRK